jgi:hypothetical protein
MNGRLAEPSKVSTMNSYFRVLLPVGTSLLALISFGGCRHLPTGTSSFEFVDGPDAPKPQDASQLRITKSMSVFVDAKPIPPLAAPVYPKNALAAHLGTVSIAVKITIGTNGRVTSIAPSFARISLPTRDKNDFDDAIEEALSEWRFEPAQLAHLDPQTADAPVIVGTEATETSFDVVFTFSASGNSSADILKTGGD